MNKRPNETERALQSLDTSALRATREATTRYAQRFATRFVDDFYRDGPFGARISSIGIGTYLGDPTDADDRAYETTVRAAISAGINTVDTAINYRCQRSELNVGAAMQALLNDDVVKRDEILVCTKGGYIPLDREPPSDKRSYQDYLNRAFIEPRILHPSEIVAGGHSIAPRFIRYCLAKSRQNLGVRTIDLYYLHNPEQQLSAVDRQEFRSRLEAAFRVLEEAGDRGEIGCYGIATWDGLRRAPGSPGHVELTEVVDAARAVAGDGHRLRAVQVPINLGMPEAVRDATQSIGGRPCTVIQAAEELGLTVVGSASLLQGRLTSGLPQTLVDLFPGLETDAQRSAAFVRSIAGVTVGLIGTRRVEHLLENLRGAAHT